MTKATTPRRSSRSPCALPSARSGTAAIELALTLPLFLTLLMGILSYGDYFLVAHAVQQAANDAARAAIAGLNSAERAQLAGAAATTNLRLQGALDPALSSIAVNDDGSTMVVHLSYDDSADPLLRLGFVPVPDPHIRRDAAISVGGL